MSSIANRILLLAILFALIASCGLVRDARINDHDVMLPGVIFSAEYSLKLDKQGSLLGLQGPYWTPTEQQVAELEKVLAEYVRSISNAHYDRLTLNLSTYKRQYLGITSSGKEVIYVNAFCDAYWSRDNTWKTDLVFVLDGGECFFQLTYDPESKEILEFNVSGEA